MDKKGDIGTTLYIIAIIVFVLLLLGILASIFISKNLEQGSSLTNAYDERIASLKTLSTINIIKVFLILVIIGAILYLWDRLTQRRAKKRKKKSKKKK